MYILYKVAKEDAGVSKKGDISYVRSDNNPFEGKFGALGPSNLTFCGDRVDAKRFDKSTANKLAKKHNLKIESVQ